MRCNQLFFLSLFSISTLSTLSCRDDNSSGGPHPNFSPGTRAYWVDEAEMTPDGGCILAMNGHPDDEELLLYKISSQGQFIWADQYDLSNDAWVRDVALLPSGDYVAVGYVAAKGGWPASNWPGGMFIVRTNEYLNHLWTRKFDYWESCLAIAVAPADDNGLVVLGESWPYDANDGNTTLVLRLDQNGDTLWTWQIHDQLSWEASKILTLENGHTLISGEGRFGFMWITELDVDGSYVGTHNIYSTDLSQSIEGMTLVENGDLVFAGDGYDQVRHVRFGDICRVSSTGSVLWEKSVTSRQSAQIFSATYDPTFGVVAAGVTSLDGTYRLDGNFCVVRLSENGDSLWGFVYGDTLTQGRAVDAWPTHDGGLLAAGMVFYVTARDTNSMNFYASPMVIRFDAAGDTVWTWRLFEGSPGAESEILVTTSQFPTVRERSGDWLR